MKISKKKGCLYLLIFFGALGIFIFSTNNINDIALQTLGLFKNITNNNVAFEDLKGTDNLVAHDLWDNLLKQYVNGEGRVNYEGFIQKRDSLKQYLDLLSNNPPNPESWSTAAQLAYWMNAYNAFTVELILQNYPVKSIKDIAGGVPMINSPWDIKFFKIGGIDFDLNTIEHEILRKEFEEPRIHFAINCASVSCPILLNEAFREEKLEEQLQERTIYFINNPLKNQLKKKEVKLSQLFNWFEKDFTKSQTLIEFINQYSRTKIEERATISFLDYDWNLNE